MATYPWPTGPGWKACTFEMRIAPNTTTFTSPYSKQTQTLDFLGERWTAKIELPADTNPVIGAAREAFFDRLKGPVNLIQLWNLRRPNPLGTLRDGVSGGAQWKTSSGANATWLTAVSAAATWVFGPPVVAGPVAQLANVIPIATTPGVTLLAGDHFGVNGQLFRAMATATADGTGLMLVEVLPRLRTSFYTGYPVVTSYPTANFMLKADGVPTTWRNGMFDGASLELIEAF